MTTFTVWKYETPDGADHAEAQLKAAAADGLVRIVDHAVLRWPETDQEPTLRQGHDEPKRGAGWGALWGTLAGALLLVPVAGAVVGAGVGALVKSLHGSGITETDLERIRSQVVPGTSALFLVTEGANLDRLGDRFRNRDSTLLSASLTPEEQATLLETFGGA